MTGQVKLIINLKLDNASQESQDGILADTINDLARMDGITVIDGRIHRVASETHRRPVGGPAGGTQEPWYGSGQPLPFKDRHRTDGS